MTHDRSLAFAPSDYKLSTETTPREEWSYILLVFRELVSMSFSQVYDNLWKKLWKKGFKING
jgi:hypothetical protein